MDPIIQELLLHYDDPVAINKPDGMTQDDIDKLYTRISEVAGKLVNEICGYPFIVERWLAPEATYMATVSLRRYAFDLNFPSRVEISIIEAAFSHFGNLFTIWNNDREGQLSTNEQKLYAKLLPIVQQTYEAHGFVYVPKEALCEAYNGENPFFQKTYWADRFFGETDYLTPVEEQCDL